MSYDEHLISMAGGDGEPAPTLDDIEAEHNSEGGWRRASHYHRGILLAMVREQQARLDKAAALIVPTTRSGRIRVILPDELRAALTKGATK